MTIEKLVSTKRLISAICVAAIASVAVIGTPSVAAEKIVVGAMLDVSGPFAVLGSDMRKATDLAIEHLGGKLGGVPLEVVHADDKSNPGTAVQLATKLVERNKVHMITGLMSSGVMMAVYKPIVDAGVFIVGSNAGPSPLAGAKCHPNVFVTSWQNDTLDEAMGQYMVDQGVKGLYLMGLDYQAGWDHIAGAKRFYKGKIVKEVYTPFKQFDFSAELAQMRAARPDGVFVFYAGRSGVAYVKQFAQAGLQGKIRLFSGLWIADTIVFKALADTAVGIVVSSHWLSSLDNAANKKFVSGFRAKFNQTPTMFAQQQYDAFMIMDAAVRAVGGNVEDKDKFRSALRNVKFDSTRGKFRFNHNHFPVQDYYIAEVVKGADGKLGHKVIATALRDHADSYHQKCAMKW